jgi:hypothetical protein
MPTIDEGGGIELFASTNCLCESKNPMIRLQNQKVPSFTHQIRDTCSVKLPQRGVRFWHDRSHSSAIRTGRSNAAKVNTIPILGFSVHLRWLAVCFEMQS